MASEVKANKISPATGTAFTLGDSGDTFTVPSGTTLDIASGATIANSGTATGFGEYAACRVKLSSDQTATKNAVMKINMDTVDFDTRGWYDNTTNYRYTPQESGYYLVIVRLSLTGTAQSNSIHVGIAKNGTVTAFTYNNNGGAGFEFGWFAQDIVHCNGSTDYIEAYGRNEATGGSWDADSLLNEGDDCFMAIIKVA